MVNRTREFKCSNVSDYAYVAECRQKPDKKKLFIFHKQYFCPLCCCCPEYFLICVETFTELKYIIFWFKNM